MPDTNGTRDRAGGHPTLGPAEVVRASLGFVIIICSTVLVLADELEAATGVATWLAVAGANGLAVVGRR